MDTSDAVVSFYCHQCDRTITPVMPQLTCPRCNGGFIERVEGGPSPPFLQQYSEPSPEDNVGPSVRNALRLLADMAEADVSGSSTPSSRLRSEIPSGASSSSNVRAGEGPRGVRGFAFTGGPNVRIGVRSGNSEMEFPWLQDFFNIVLGAGWQMDQGGTGGIPILFNMPSGNVGDYAWGPQGLDNVVTQLLNQLEGQGGTPPLSQEEIDNIAKIPVTEPMREKSSQCSVCMDDFDIGEDVRRLSCDHFFHEQCIIPWVQRHGTCPVCRKELSSTPRPAQPSGPQLIFGGGAGSASSPQANGAAGGSAEPRSEGSANQASSNAHAASSFGQSSGSTFNRVRDRNFPLDEPDID